MPVRQYRIWNRFGACQKVKKRMTSAARSRQAVEIFQPPEMAACCIVQVNPASASRIETTGQTRMACDPNISLTPTSGMTEKRSEVWR